jgi:hypothetical protein
VFDAGKKAEYNAFWNEFQQNGSRKDYPGAFYGPGWTNQTFKPKYNMRPSNCGSMFHSSMIEDLSALLEQAGVTLDTSASKRADSMFYWASNLKKVPILDFRNVTDSNCFQQTFQSATKLETIEKLILSNDGAQTFNKAFGKAYSLKNITFEGVIGQDGFNVADCTLLTHESLMSIINALQQYNGDGKTHTVTLGQANISKLSEQEIASVTQKGWTISS